MSGGGDGQAMSSAMNPGFTNTGQQRLPAFTPQNPPAQSPVIGARGGSGLGMGSTNQTSGGFMPNYGWNVGGNQPAYTHGPTYATPQLPQPYGGYWNQLTQMMAGPQYQANVNPQKYANQSGFHQNGWGYPMGLMR